MPRPGSGRSTGGVSRLGDLLPGCGSANPRELHNPRRSERCQHVGCCRRVPWNKLCRANRNKEIHPMRKYALSILIMTAVTGTAMAQQPAAPPPAASGGPEHVNADRAGPPPIGPEGDMGPRGHRPPPPPPLSKAAHFRIEDGPKVIDIKCADDEPVKACADILSQVLDRMSGPMQPAR